MSTEKRLLSVDWPILYGTISVASAKCGQKNCRCHRDPVALHGPYYRWIGKLNGKITTKTLTKEVADECRWRIANYRKLQNDLECLLQIAIDSAPWNEDDFD